MTKKLPNQLSRPLFSVCRSFLGKLGTTVSKGMQVFVVMLIFTAAMLTNQSTKAATQVYLIPQSQLVNLASTCGTGSYYNGCSSLRPGFTWTDVLSGGTTITSVTIEFNVGVECGPTLHTTELNGAAEANFTTSVNWCNCTGSGQPAFSMPGTLANYVVGGSNTFTFDSPLSTCVGLAQDAAIGGQYARITVDYVSPCVTPVVSASPATSCSSPLTTDLVGISAGNNIDWFDAASGGTYLGSAASGSNFPQTLSGTTTYYAEASGGSCITSTPRVPVLVSIGVPPAPSSVIAVEDSICPLLTSSLSAMAPGYTIDWYNASSGGTLLGSSASGASFVVSPSGTTTYYAEASASGCTSATRTAVTVYVTLTSPAAPFGGSASPSVICPSALSDISASAATAIIDWYDAPTGGTLLATVSSGSPFTVSPSVTTTYYAQANEAIPGGTTTFNYTGAAQSFTVPAGVLSLTIDARGGQGGVSSGFTGGLGARMEGTFAVTPGQVLTVVVGAQGVRSYNSGSGGGGSGVVDGATPMIIAGGGGGASENGSENGQAGQITTTGGNSSGPGGSAGSGGQKGYVSGDCGWAGGGGGFSGDGYGGDGGWDGGPLPGVLGTVGGARSWLNGGAGGSNGGCSFSYPNNGVFGCGGGGSGSYGAGGGGGYSGGGGGHYTASSGQRCGGGGGSLNTGTSQTNTAGFQSGNGQVIITSALVAGCVSLTRLPVTVTIGTPAAPLSATVSDDTICPSDAVILTGIAPGHDINWYDVASGGTALGTVATGVGFSVSPTVTTTYYAETSLGGCSSATRTSVTVYVVLPPAPLSASASPSSICPGAISLLSAVASGMYINFYDAASGGTLIGGAISGASVGVSPLVTTTYYASAITLSPGGSVSYPYTGAMESFTVPIGATSISIEAFGAQGRSADGSFVGGLGARMKGDFAVTGGDQLIVLTGAQGLVIGGSGGGGGGSFVVKVDASSSDVIASGPFAGTSVTPLLIAGGGAGTRTSVSQNGNPGVTTNTATTASGSGMTGGGAVSGATPGLGGSVSSSSWGSAGGGFRGTGASDGSYGTGGSSFLNGGAGGVNACSGGGACGGFGSAGSGGGCDGGGGGGGYTGGDGGRVAGGGGSFNTGSAQSNTDGVRSGNGLITITWNNILGCESATRTPVTVTVTGISPAAPTPVTVTPTDICVSGTVLLNAIAAGDNINWYVADSAGILLGTSVSGVDFSQYTDSTTIFYAEAISSFGCQSLTRTPVTVVMHPALVAPTITGSGSAITCSGSVTLSAIGSGTSLDWFDASSGGTLLCSGCASYTTPTISTSTSYWVETTDGVCSSPRTQVDIVVTPYPAPTITGSGSAISCSGSVTITAIGSGSSLDWYDAPSGGTSLCIGCASYTTPTISTSTTYWVEATNGVCTSPRTAVTILVVIPFGLPTVTSTPAPSAICAGSSIDLNAVTTSTTINWYDAATGGTLLTTVGTGVNYTVSPTVTTSYWAEATDGGACFAGREKITVIVTSVTPPTPVTATASTICIGSSSLLNGTSAGNSINWYTDSVGGTSIGTSASAANFSVTPSSTTTYYAEAASPAFSAGTATFAYTGAMQSFTVPAGVVSINIDALGAQGISGGSFVGGLGARMSGNFNVTPGDQLIVLTGQQGIRIGNSGGGGGGSFVVKVDSTSIDMITAGPFAGTSVTPLVIAGGGAGIRGSASQNGNPGVTTNTATTASGGSSSGGGAVSGTTPGLGGIASSSSWGSGGGGFRGDGASDGSYGTGGTSFLSGGAGGLKSCSSGGSCGGFGSGGSGGGCYGGGGGGGYTGGDGGWIGGGGGSYNIGTGQVNTDGVRSGNGLVTITWSGYSGCASPTRTAVTVTVNTAPVIVTHPTPTTTLTIGSYFSLYVVATGAVSSYQWYRGGTLLSGATDDTLIIPSVISTDAGNYTCRVTGCGTVISTIGVLSITISLAGDSRCVPVRFEPTGVFAETAERNLGVANPDCDTIVSNNSASSNETGEPFGSAAGSGGFQRTMWYTMKSPTCAANSVRFSTNTSPTDFNSRLTAYHRVDPLLCTGAMVELASIDDDGFGSMTDAASVTLLPGTGASSSSTFLPGAHIYAQVSGFDGASGNYGIVVDVDAPAITAGTVTSGTIEVNLDYAALHAYGVPFSSFYLRSRKVGDPLTRYTQRTISSSSTTATISGLISGESYDVWMMYRCSAGDRWVSSKITVTTIAGCSGPIAAPTVVASSTSAGVACKSVDIGWTPSSLATMYTVRWALASTPARYSSRSVTAPASSYTTGAVLVSGTNYICWVITTCVGGATFTSPVTTFTTCGAIPRMSDPDASTEDGVYAYNNLEFHHMGINDISMSIDVQNGEVNLTRVEGSGNESGTPLITAIKMIDNMSIHPNPARTAATLSYLLPSESESMSITIYDAQGKEVSSELISDPSLAGDYIINLSNYASGLYFVKAQTGNFSETRKLVVDKD